MLEVIYWAITFCSREKASQRHRGRTEPLTEPETTSLVLASLDEYTSYQFTIQAFNRKGVAVGVKSWRERQIKMLSYLNSRPVA